MSRHRSPVSGFFGLRRPARTAIDSFPGSRMATVRRDDLEVRAGATFLRARALQPDPAVAWVLLAHAGMPDLQARQVAERLAGDGYATLQLDLGTGRVVDTLDAAADLGEQTRAAMAWLRGQTFFDARQMALLGLRDAAPAALWAAGEGPELAGPVVAGGHRPDLAGARLGHIVAPTLLVSPGSAAETLERHRQALAQLRGACRLQMGRGPEGWTDAGACELAWLAGSWFERHLCVSQRPMMAEPRRAWGLLRRAGAHRRELRVAMALAFLGWLVLPRTVRAAVTSGVSGGVLTATSDGADGIVVTCTGGNVKINGADPGRGPEACASITQVVLTGGPGANAISFTATSATFPSVTGVTIDGGAGNDVLTGSDLNDTIRGGSGADSIVGGLGDDSLDGGSADTAFDRVSASGGSDLVLSNTLLTGVGTDTLSGFERASLSGTAGNDTLDASAFTLGPVTLIGIDGNDTLLGSGGDDVLMGGLGDDSYAGGAGNDNLSESGGGGGGGNDTFGGDAGTDWVTEVPTDVDQTVTDTALTGPGTNVMSSIEGVSLTGGPGANRLDARSFTAGRVTLGSAAFKLWLVTLDGAAGNDTLLGSGGDDVLRGGLGDDQLLGGKAMTR